MLRLYAFLLHARHVEGAPLRFEACAGRNMSAVPASLCLIGIGGMLFCVQRRWGRARPDAARRVPSLRNARDARAWHGPPASELAYVVARYRPLVSTARPMRVERTQGSTRNTRSHGWCVCVQYVRTQHVETTHRATSARPSRMGNPTVIAPTADMPCARSTTSTTSEPFDLAPVMPARVRVFRLCTFACTVCDRTV